VIILAPEDSLVLPEYTSILHFTTFTHVLSFTPGSQSIYPDTCIVIVFQSKFSPVAFKLKFAFLKSENLIPVEAEPLFKVIFPEETDVRNF
jgi:hypothetical protein